MSGRGLREDHALLCDSTFGLLAFSNDGVPRRSKLQRHSWGLASWSLMGEHEQVVCGSESGDWRGVRLTEQGAGLITMVTPPSSKNSLAKRKAEDSVGVGVGGRHGWGPSGGEAQKCLFAFPL